MAREDLTATLGVDGRPFEQGIDAIFAKSAGGMRAVGRRFGRQIVGGIMAVVGLQFIRGVINETQRWARDTAAVRAEYEKMGVIISDEMAGKMAEVGRQYTMLGAQWKAALLPLVGGISEGMLRLVQYLKEAAFYWRYMYEHDLQPRVETAADFWYKFAQVMAEERQPGRGKLHGKETGGDKLKRAWREASRFVGSVSPSPMNPREAAGRAGSEMDAMSRDFEEMMSRLKFHVSEVSQSFSLSRGGSGAGRLASIGGDVGGLNDRVMRVEQEQVRILKQIASNTRARTPGSGGLEIPTS